MENEHVNSVKFTNNGTFYLELLLLVDEVIMLYLRKSLQSIVTIISIL